MPEFVFGPPPMLCPSSLCIASLSVFGITMGATSADLLPKPRAVESNDDIWPRFPKPLAVDKREDMSSRPLLPNPRAVDNSADIWGKRKYVVFNSPLVLFNHALFTSLLPNLIGPDLLNIHLLYSCLTIIWITYVWAFLRKHGMTF